MSIDAVFIAGERDFPILAYGIPSLRKWSSVNRIIVVAKRDPGFKNMVYEFFDESLFPFQLEDVKKFIPDPRATWYYQQLLKMYAAFVIPNLNNIAIIDADVVFLKPIKFIEEGKVLLNVSTEYWQPYFDHMLRLHPSFKRILGLSGIAHYTVFNKAVLQALLSLIELRHGDLFWKVFLKLVEPEMYSHSGASEYELYFNYILQFYPVLIEVRPLPYCNDQNSWKPEDVYIAFHHYIRRSNWEECLLEIQGCVCLAKLSLYIEHP